MTRLHDDRPSLSYIRFLNLVKAIRGLPPFPALAAEEEEMLELLALSWHQHQRISVADVMRSVPELSRSTTYRRLVALKDKGMIEFVDDVHDGRVKIVTATTLAEDYFRRVSDCIDGLVAHGRPA